MIGNLYLQGINRFLCFPLLNIHVCYKTQKMRTFLFCVSFNLFLKDSVCLSITTWHLFLHFYIKRTFFSTLKSLYKCRHHYSATVVSFFSYFNKLTLGMMINNVISSFQLFHVVLILISLHVSSASSFIWSPLFIHNKHELVYLRCNMSSIPEMWHVTCKHGLQTV